MIKNIIDKCKLRHSMSSSKAQDSESLKNKSLDTGREPEIGIDRLDATTTVAVDNRRIAFFTLPTHPLVETSPVFRQHLTGCSASSSLLKTTSDGTLYLPTACASHFLDFAKWLDSSSPPDLKPTVASLDKVDNADAIDRLIDAIGLGITLQSRDYQNTAVSQLLPLLKSSRLPEEFAVRLVKTSASYSPSFSNESMARTSIRRSLDASGINAPVYRSWRSQHPARRMLVTVVAACTVGKGKRRFTHFQPLANGQQERTDGKHVVGIVPEHVRLLLSRIHHRLPNGVNDFMV